MAWVSREAESAFLLLLPYHLCELFFAPNIDPAKKVALALATAETCNFAAVVCGFQRIAISEHVRIVVVSYSATTVAYFDFATIAVASDPVTPAVAFGFAMTAVASAALTDVASAAQTDEASDHGKNAVVSE
uniref:Uncharacterized protein n=1 Tax=Arundo donax TaxID=35708 RepID=A0A0A9EF16_ARUDO